MTDSNRILEDAHTDGSLETLLASINKERGIISGLQPSSPFHSTRSLIVNVLLLLLASTSFALWFNSIQRICTIDPLLTYSPVNEAVQYIETQFDGSLHSTSVFCGYPSPEIDSAWERVSIHVGATRLTHHQFLKIGGNDSTAVIKYQPQDGGGYMSQIDGYHHVHCLDMLRKYLRRDYYSPFDVSFNSVLHPHLGHCVEIIRQKLMCTSDVTMAKYEWVPGVDRLTARANLSTTHQCVDFEGILDWTGEHNAHVLASHVVRFGDATDLPEEPM